MTTANSKRCLIYQLWFGGAEINAAVHQNGSARLLPCNVVSIASVIGFTYLRDYLRLCLDCIFRHFSWKNYCSDLIYVREKGDREMWSRKTIIFSDENLQSKQGLNFLSSRRVSCNPFPSAIPSGQKKRRIELDPFRIPWWSSRRWKAWRRPSEFQCRCSDSYCASLPPFLWASSTGLFLGSPEDTSTPPSPAPFCHICRLGSRRTFTSWSPCFWATLPWSSAGNIVGSSHFS